MQRNNVKEKVKQVTKNKQFVLASSSQTRILIAKQIFENIKVVKHNFNEEKERGGNPDHTKTALLLAKGKACSVAKQYPKDIVIGSDQILICNNKLINKVKSKQQAKKKLEFLSGKKHTLWSAIYVINEQKKFYEQIKKAVLKFKILTNEEIENYIEKNPLAVFNSVGSYKIEDNHKHNFVKIITGDRETILGFPLKGFLRKLLDEEDGCF